MSTVNNQELERQLWEHFIEGAPNYDSANEYQQALARIETDKILPLFRDKETEIRLDEFYVASEIWNVKGAEIKPKSAGEKIRRDLLKHKESLTNKKGKE